MPRANRTAADFGAQRPELRLRLAGASDSLAAEREAYEIGLRRFGDVELDVASDDLGKVIGRQGRTVRALRNLLDSRGDREGETYRLEILD